MIKNADWICPPADTGEACPVFSKNIGMAALAEMLDVSFCDLLTKKL